MAVRGRAASSTPQDTVEELASRTGTQIPGDDDTRTNRVDALGPLTGLAAGIGTGLLLGAARAVGVRPGPAGTFVAATAVVLVAGNGPMTALGIVDPRTWGVNAWVTDVVPHVAYGLVTAYVLNGLDDS